MSWRWSQSKVTGALGPSSDTLRDGKFYGSPEAVLIVFGFPSSCARK